MNNKAVISGIRWTLITSILRRIITLILFYFIAKWLSKEDLGVFREYSIIMAFMALVSFLSLDYHYIIEQRRDKTSLTALWQITFIASIIGFILLNIGSSLIGYIYKSDILGKLFSYTSIFFVVEMFRRAVRSVATKRLQFKEMAVAETINVIFYSLVSILALYFVRTIWVFLIVFYLGNMVELIYLWKCNQAEISKTIKNSFSITRRKVLSLTWKANRAFLTQATAVSIFNQISTNAPILLLGLIIKPELIGLYYFSSQIIGIPAGMFTNAINQVFFPVFAGKKDGDIGNMSTRYIRLVGYIGMPSLLVFSFIMTFVVGWLFQDKWDEAIPLIMPLFVLFGTGLYCAPLGGVPFIKRKPNWELNWNIGSLIIKMIAMYIGLQTSFVMAIWLYAIASAISNIYFYFMAMVLVQQKLSDTFGNMGSSFIPTLLLSTVIIVTTNLHIWLAITSVLLSYCVLLFAMNLLSKGVLLSDIRMLTRRAKD